MVGHHYLHGTMDCHDLVRVKSVVVAVGSFLMMVHYNM
jgi:hypothetical protein